MLTLGSLAFASPWILTALLALPAIWLLIRITPPAPRTVFFPAIRLLYGLQSPEETPDRTPWWLLLLRLLFATLVILGLAQPLLGARGGLPPGGPILIVIDDGWSAAHDWQVRMTEAGTLLDQAARENRRVALLTASGTAEEGKHAPGALLAPEEARKLLGAVKPKPWSVPTTGLGAVVERAELPRPTHVFWLTDGVADAGDAELAAVLQRLGSLTVYRSAGGPKAVTAHVDANNALAARVVRLHGGAAEPVAIRAIATDGRVLTSAPGRFESGARQAEITIAMPLELRNDIGRLDIEKEGSAAGVALLDESFRRRPVGLVSETEFAAAQPLLEEVYYLDRALSPFSEIRRGRLGSLVGGSNSVIILPDTGLLPPAERSALRNWIERGGTLVRFAGPRLAAAGLENRGLGTEELVPVRLRGGDRSLGGVLSWTQPAALAPFERGSAFADLPFYSGVMIRKQVLAEPSIELTEKTWAKLADGTPIVTASRLGEGRIVLFHTTANTDWSDLAISGAFVEMLRRIVALSVGVDTAAGGRLEAPLQALDGFGRLGQPPATAKAYRNEGKAPSDLAIGPDLPPGYYGSELARVAVNLGPAVSAMTPLGSMPSGVAERGFAGGEERDLAPFILAAALALLLADFAITLVMRGLVPGGGRRGGAVAGLVLAALLATAPAAAQAPAAAEGDEAFAMKAALGTHLAYVITGDPGVDEISRSGLAALSDVLNRRTAIEPEEPIAVDIEVDELAFFPLLYWPIVPNQADLTDAAIARLNAYMRNGGTVFFDTRDQVESGFGGVGPGMQRLREIARRLDIPALVPVPANHVLTKSFYLLDEFPGRYTGGRVWVQEGPGEQSGEVSAVIIGSHDWAGAWARTPDGQFRFPVIPGGELQREMAFRTGVNLLMYMYTGNYKADQVHVPAILERLGQ